MRGVSALLLPGAAAARSAGVVVGVLADAAFGDPRRGHPVALFGQVAASLESALYRPARRRGVVHTAVLVGACAAAGATAERCARSRPAVRVAVTAVATWTALGKRSLASAGAAMVDALERGDLGAARLQLGHLCARSPDGLDEPALARATVESLAENTSDAVVAPLLWAAVGGAPGVLAYRAANTLDAMVGYRSPRYRRFGWAAARLDDVLNLAPARLTGLLTVVAAPVVGGSVGHAWRVFRRDASAHPSPNAGRCEAAAAGALGVRLGGVNVYEGHEERRPSLGDGPPPASGDIRRAVHLTRVVGAAATVLAAVGPPVAAVAVPALVRRVRRAGGGR